MFNYECTQMGGTVVGSCLDVFLFGACCRLPDGARVPTVEQSGPTTAIAVTSDSRHPSYGEQPPLSFQQPVADTILLHRNGSAVQNTYRPDDMSADLLANFSIATAMLHANHRPVDITDIMTSEQLQYTTSSDGHHRRPPFSATKITSKVDYGDSGWPSTTAKHTSPSSSSSSPVSKSTDSVPNIRKTTPFAAVQATTSKQGYGGHNTDDYYDSMVLIPTLTVHDPNAKTPIENNSIHHILSILNHTPPPPTSTDGHNMADEQDPMDTSSSYMHTKTSSSQSPPALFTWGSIEGDSKSPNYGSSSSFPVTKPSSVIHSSYYPQTQHYDRPSVTNYYGSTPSTPSTSTHHLPGPHFHVLSTTAKPIVDPALPTVIVLSSANDSKNPNKYSTSTTTTTTTSSLYSSSLPHRPPPSSHVKPSQSIIVTGKPSVSAAYTTTATYHQHSPQQQQDIAFVPVSSTTLADKYYNANYHQTNGLVHTSAKPLMSAKPSSTYGHWPTSVTTSSTTPPTLSSTIHHDNNYNNNNKINNNNNVFTTVITSVNHQYHNKYQPTTASTVPGAGTYSTAKPVLNQDGAATVAVLSSSTGGGYRPHQPTAVVSADDDYPSPVVTPVSQVFITASDVHHHHQLLQQHTSSSSYPSSTSVISADDVPPFNSTDTFAFPPVRDPNVNLTAATQQEKPDVAPGIDGGDYDSDADPNPQLTADDNLDDKVHLFVEKVVQSLQGNFEDLEKVLMSGDPSSSNITIGNDDPTSWPNKKPTTTTTTKKPPKPVGKPTKPPPTKITTSTYRPTPITLSLDGVPYLEVTTTVRPTKVPTLLTPVQLFQPTTYASRPPTKQPNRVTSSTTVVLDTLNVEHDYTTAEPDYRKGTCQNRKYEYNTTWGHDQNLVYLAQV